MSIPNVDDRPLIVEAEDPNGTFYGVDPRPHAFRRPFRGIDRIDEQRFVVPAAGLITRVDLLMSRVHAKRLRARLRYDYSLMRETSPGIFRLPGAQDLTINHMTGMYYDSGHYFAYVPRTEPGRRLGIMVFLHGHAGNFRLFIWRWRSLALRANLAVIAPSFGFGIWGRESARIVESSLNDALGRWPVIDPAQGLWLSGLSAGGSGVIRSSNLRPWNGLVFLSAVMPQKLAGRACDSPGKSVPGILVLNGQADHNVSHGSVRRGVDFFRSRGVKVEHHVYNEEDHYMTFAEADDVDNRMLSWMNSVGPTN